MNSVHARSPVLPGASDHPAGEAVAPSGHILVVDDDEDIRDLLAAYLAGNGFRVTTARDGASMRRALETGRHDLVVLDVMLPGEDGLALCRDLRARSSLPVIMLTARTEDIDRIIGIEMGADDYLGKPFNPRELLARIRGVLRRTGLHAPVRREVASLRFGDWIFDRHSRCVVDLDGTSMPLSGAQYKLLSVFLAHPQRVLDRDLLIDLTQGREANPFDRSIDVQVSRLRALLGDNGREPRLIRTVRNGGYVLVTPVEPLT